MIDKAAAARFSAVTKQIKDSFEKITREFDDHLTSINQNTVEIQSNYECLSELDAKLEKISQRLEKIELFLNMDEHANEKFSVYPLTFEEKKIFMVLYTEGEKQNLTYEAIANKVHLSPSLVQNYVTNMVAKGIPIEKKFVNNKAFLAVNQAFKEAQAKENILKIS